MANDSRVSRALTFNDVAQLLVNLIRDEGLSVDGRARVPHDWRKLEAWGIALLGNEGTCEVCKMRNLESMPGLCSLPMCPLNARRSENAPASAPCVEKGPITSPQQDANRWAALMFVEPMDIAVAISGAKDGTEMLTRIADHADAFIAKAKAAYPPSEGNGSNGQS